MPYDLVPISLALIVAYIFTYTLYKKKVIHRALHVRIWNILILVTFLVSAIAGIILIALIEWGITVYLSPSLLFWHVDIGIALFAISIFHIHCYWKSFRKVILRF
jgi:hypothetical protein